MRLEFWLYTGLDWAGLCVTSERAEKPSDMMVVSSIPLKSQPHWTSCLCTCCSWSLEYSAPHLSDCVLLILQGTAGETLLQRLLPWHSHTAEGTFHLCSSDIFTYLVETVSCSQHLFSPSSMTVEWYLDMWYLTPETAWPSLTAVRCVYMTKFMLRSCHLYVHVILGPSNVSLMLLPNLFLPHTTGGL